MKIEPASDEEGVVDYVKEEEWVSHLESDLTLDSPWTLPRPPSSLDKDDPNHGLAKTCSSS